ncbi:MAG: sulfur carrier protein ThiS [Bacteroidales bacterium]
MKIFLNNTIEYFKDDILTVNELLIRKNFTFKMLVVKINGKLIRKEQYATTLIREEDVVIVMHLISRG